MFLFLSHMFSTTPPRNDRQPFRAGGRGFFQESRTGSHESGRWCGREETRGVSLSVQILSCINTPSRPLP